MIKAIFMLRRKPGITHVQFREHYENSHARLGQKYLGHLMISYVRNYVSHVRADGSAGGGSPWNYDCITEWVLPSQEALDEIFRIFADPVIGKIFRDDELNFLDSAALIAVSSVESDVVNTGTGGGHGLAEHRFVASA